MDTEHYLLGCDVLGAELPAAAPVVKPSIFRRIVNFFRPLPPPPAPAPSKVARSTRHPSDAVLGEDVIAEVEHVILGYGEAYDSTKAYKANSVALFPSGNLLMATRDLAPGDTSPGAWTGLRDDIIGHPHGGHGGHGHGGHGGRGGWGGWGWGGPGWDYYADDYYEPIVLVDEPEVDEDALRAELSSLVEEEIKKREAAKAGAVK